MQFTNQNAKQIWLSILTSGIIWFLLLGCRDLIGSEEGRYAEIAREMLASGDWVTPRLNGYKYFEKPPLHYWGSAISMMLFGINNVAARLWCAVLGFLGAVWVGYVGRRLYGKMAGYYAFLMSISTLIYVLLGHTNSLDMGVSVFLTFAIGALVLAQSERNNKTKSRNLMLLSWAAMAAATMSKGLIGIVLPGGGVFIYILWQRDWQMLRCLHIGKGLLLFLFLTAPWFIAVSMKNPEFAHFFFIHEHFERFAEEGHKRNKPIWFFLVILLAGSLPWLGSTFNALIKPSFTWKAKPGQFEASRLLWSYALFIFVFFSMSNSKLLPYILPMFPAIFLLVGEKATTQPKFILDGIMAAVLAIALLFLAWDLELLAKIAKTQVSVMLVYRPWIISAALLLICGSTCFLLLKDKKCTAMTVLAFCSLLAFQMISWGFQSQNKNMSNRIMADAIRPYLTATSKIYSIEGYDRPLSFYLGRTLTLVEYKDELEFGIGIEPGDFIETVDSFIPIWMDADNAVAILHTETYQQRLKNKVPMQVIYQDWKRVAVIRSAQPLNAILKE